MVRDSLGSLLVITTLTSAVSCECLLDEEIDQGALGTARLTFRLPKMAPVCPHQYSPAFLLVLLPTK